MVLDPEDRILLVRFDWPDGGGMWAAPGGGIRPDETIEEALRRELAEEVGMHDPVLGPAIWTRTHVFPFLDGSHDGQADTYYLVRGPAFEPDPMMSWEDLHAEYVTAMRWWALDELTASQDTFSPRRLPSLLATLIVDGPPDEPFDVGV